MDYNTTRPKLILSEYGRNIQNMVEHALTITNRDERQRCAETIISVMASRFPQQKEGEELERILWDHLAFISGYKLDVVSPYPINIQTAEGDEHPHMDYPTTAISYRHYGHTIELMAQALAEMGEDEDREGYTELVVAQMAKSLAVWNSNILTPKKLADDLVHLTGGKVSLDIPEERLNAIIQTAVAQSKPVGKKKKKK